MKKINLIAILLALIALAAPIIAQNPVKVPGREYPDSRKSKRNNSTPERNRPRKTSRSTSDSQTYVDYKKIDYDNLMKTNPATPKGKFDRAIVLSLYVNNNSVNFDTSAAEDKIWKLLTESASGGYGEALTVIALSELAPDVNYLTGYYLSFLKNKHTKGYKSLDDIMDQLKRASNLGSGTAMKLISDALFGKKPGNQSQYQEAFDMLLKAAENNNLDAQKKILNYQNVINFPYNTNFSVDLTYWAKRLDCNPAAYRDYEYIAKLCEKKYGYHIDEVNTYSMDKLVFYDGTHDYSKCDQEGLGRKFRCDFEAGVPETIALAAFYFDCNRATYRIGNDDMAYSTSLYKQLADMGNNVGRFIYAQRLRDGLGCTRDEIGAKRMMQTILSDTSCDAHLLRITQEELASWN